MILENNGQGGIHSYYLEEYRGMDISSTMSWSQSTCTIAIMHKAQPQTSSRPGYPRNHNYPFNKPLNYELDWRLVAYMQRPNNAEMQS